MIPFIIPLFADANLAATKVSNENYQIVSDYAITRLYDDKRLNIDLDSYKLLTHESVSTFVDINQDLRNNSETWNEILEQNFDVVSKIKFKSSIKLKVKIKSITKFTPNIVIE